MTNILKMIADDPNLDPAFAAALEPERVSCLPVTITHGRLPLSGCGTITYSGKDRDAVEAKAKTGQDHIDYMRSPSLSMPCRQPDGTWFVVLTFFGTD